MNAVSCFYYVAAKQPCARTAADASAEGTTYARSADGLRPGRANDRESVVCPLLIQQMIHFLQIIQTLADAIQCNLKPQSLKSLMQLAVRVEGLEQR